MVPRRRGMRGRRRPAIRAFPAAALQAAITGLIQYPDHAELLNEQAALLDLVGVLHEGAMAD